MELGKQRLLLTHTHKQIQGREVRSGGAKKGGGKREAAGTLVSLGWVG